MSNTFAIQVRSRVSIPIEAKFVGGIGEVSGYAAIYGGAPDSYGDVIAPGAFDDSLAQHSNAGTMPAMLWAHDQAQPIGKWLSADSDARGLHVVGKLNLGYAAGQQAYSHLKHGDVSGISIGFSPGRSGRTRHADGTATLKSAVLHEMSVVAVPANRRARILQVKSFDGATSLASQDDLQALLEAQGMSSDHAEAIAANGWPGLGFFDDDDDDETSLKSLRARVDTSLLELKSLGKAR